MKIVSRYSCQGNNYFSLYHLLAFNTFHQFNSEIVKEEKFSWYKYIVCIISQLAHVFTLAAY